MSWKILTAANVQTEGLSPDEVTSLQTIQGANLPAILCDAVNQAIGAIRSGGYQFNADGTVPDQLRADIIAVARWRWFSAVPGAQALLTDARKAANDEAIKRFALIARQGESIEPPTAGANPRSGQWDSENKLVPRTHPVPPPSVQFQTDQSDTQPPYANPNAPSDN